MPRSRMLPVDTRLSVAIPVAVRFHHLDRLPNSLARRIHTLSLAEG